MFHPLAWTPVQAIWIDAVQDKRPICAIATAPGQGAIGVVRVSAPEPDIITALAADILGPERRLVARKAAYGPFLAADAQPIDYGLALWFPAPHSYTGEHILELQGHGGPVRPADPAAPRAAGRRCLRHPPG